ncbi:MAG: hypothetical protein U5M23_08750 [Marinagarivorans sp.]|nr:hypothetical protein [Marinagarivorans sp.]
MLRKRMTEENITWRSFWNGPLGTGGPISARWIVPIQNPHGLLQRFGVPICDTHYGILCLRAQTAGLLLPTAITAGVLSTNCAPCAALSFAG